MRTGYNNSLSCQEREFWRPRSPEKLIMAVRVLTI
jgi:hypothetical protein